MRRLLGVGLAACCLVASGCTCGDSRKAGGPGAKPAVSERSAVLAELPEQVPPSAAGGPPPAPTALAEGAEFVFAALGGGVAWVGGTSGAFRVVHNGRAGRPYPDVGSVVLSRDGRRFAHAASVDGKWRMVVDGVEGASFSSVETPVFSPDGSHVAYQGYDGRSWYLVVDTRASPAGPSPCLDPTFSADSTRLAFVAEPDAEGWGKLVVSDVALEKRAVVEPRVSNFVPNAARSRVAAIAASGDRQQVITLELDHPERVSRGPKYDVVQGLDFAPDGVSVAYAAERGGERFIVLDGKEAPLPREEELLAYPVVRPDKAAVGVLVMSNAAVTLREFFQAAPQEPGYEGAESLVYSADGRSHAYAAKRGERWFIVVNGKEGPSFDRVVSPLFTPDGTRLLYRARGEGKRFVVVADLEAKTMRQLPPHEQVFPVQFTADGKSIAYGVKDGRQLAWRVEPL